MKEYPQESCTNCTKDCKIWCVCKKCRLNKRIVQKVKALDVQYIFEALACLTDSGYKLSRREKSAIEKLITIQRLVKQTLYSQEKK